MKFEIMLQNCADAINKVNEDKELCTAISRAKEIAIDIYGNVEFAEAAEFVGEIQELAPEDADVIFRVMPRNSDGSNVTVIFTAVE